MQKLPLVFILSAVVPSWACTAAVVPFHDGLVIARSLEWGWWFTHDPEKIFFHPKGHTDDGADTGEPSNYGMVCITTNSVDGKVPGSQNIATLDGINEEGLTVSTNVHHAAEYQTKTSASNNIGHHQVAKHLLAQYSTVKEAIDYLKGVRVYRGLSEKAPGSHWLVADSNGDAVTIEFIDGELKVYNNNNVGVLTNDPSFDWHLGYVDQFAGYSVKTIPNAPNKTSCGQFSKSMSTSGGDDEEWPACKAYTDEDPEDQRKNVEVNTPKSTSNGMETRLLPGSYTPADRFVRTFLIKETVMQEDSLKPKTLDQALVVGTGLLNNVHIVRGSVGNAHRGVAFSEYTAWAVLKVPKYEEHGPYFYYRTYENMQWNKIDLKQLKEMGAFRAGAAKINPIPFPSLDRFNEDSKWGSFDAGVKDTTPQCCSPGETANGSRTLLFASIDGGQPQDCVDCVDHGDDDDDN